MIIANDNLNELRFAYKAGKDRILKDTMELIQSDLKRYKKWSPDYRMQFVNKHFDKFTINSNAEVIDIHVLGCHDYTRKDRDSWQPPA